MALKKDEMIYGWQPVMEAIDEGKEIEKVFILKTMQINRSNEIKRAALDRDIPFQFVPKEKLNRLTRQNHQGVVAVVSAVEYDMLENIVPMVFEKGETPFFLILDKITDVRNFGAIARSAECAGVDAIIIPTHGAASITSDAIKTSAGALTKIPVCREKDLKKTIVFFKESGLKVLGVTEKADSEYFKANLNVPLALIMGSEEKGISEEYLKLCDIKVSIPMKGTIESLNVSVASGILMFEVLRQRENQ